jgi:predicted Co/Zn/Cd cation transporter (cation efflux family)
MKIKNEKQLIISSILGALGFALGGIILGNMVDSQMIIFDGLYSFISLGLSMLSLWAMGSVSKHKNIQLFKSGKPITVKVDTAVVFIKYSVILFIVTGSLITAISALLDGGRNTSLNYALLYSIISTIACYGVYVMLRNPSKKKNSALLRAEAHQWLMDTWASLGVLVGFIIGFILSLIPAASFLVPYTDPFMVVLVSLYFIRIPIKEIRKNYLQLTAN